MEKNCKPFEKWEERIKGIGLWLLFLRSILFYIFNPVVIYCFFRKQFFLRHLLGSSPVTLKRRGTDRIVHMGPLLCMSRGARALTTPLCQLHGCLWLTYLQLLQVVSLALAIATSSTAYQPLWLVALSSHSSGRRKYQLAWKLVSTLAYLQRA